MESLFAERGHDAFGEDFPDALDESRGEIPLNSHERFGRKARNLLRFELAAVNFVHYPMPLGGNFFSFPCGLSFSDNRNLSCARKLKLGRGLYMKDGVAGRFVVEYNAPYDTFHSLKSAFFIGYGHIFI